MRKFIATVLLVVISSGPSFADVLRRFEAQIVVPDASLSSKDQPFGGWIFNSQQPDGFFAYSELARRWTYWTPNGSGSIGNVPSKIADFFGGLSVSQVGFARLNGSELPVRVVCGDRETAQKQSFQFFAGSGIESIGLTLGYPGWVEYCSHFNFIFADSGGESKSINT